VLALPFLALRWYGAALAAILLNRLLDGLDGALARRRGLTDAGGFLDISLDFLFMPWCRSALFWPIRRKTPLAGGWLLFALSAPAAVSRLCRAGGNIRSPTRLRP
jgi:phosphatidylglycerophosphate synthase